MNKKYPKSIGYALNLAYPKRSQLLLDFKIRFFFMESHLTASSHRMSLPLYQSEALARIWLQLLLTLYFLQAESLDCAETNFCTSELQFFSPFINRQNSSTKSQVHFKDMKVFSSFFTKGHSAANFWQTQSHLFWLPFSRLFSVSIWSSYFYPVSFHCFTITSIPCLIYFGWRFSAFFLSLPDLSHSSPSSSH